MPIYEYECESCGVRHEVIQKMSDPPLKECPQCSEPSLRKLVSAAGFRLSGGGWYETDFKSGGRRNLAEKDAKGDKADKADKAAKSGKEAGDSKKSEPKSKAVQKGGAAAGPASS